VAPGGRRGKEGFERAVDWGLVAFAVAWQLADESGSGQLVALVEQFVEVTS